MQAIRSSSVPRLLAIALGLATACADTPSAPDARAEPFNTPDPGTPAIGASPIDAPTEPGPAPPGGTGLGDAPSSLDPNADTGEDPSRDGEGPSADASDLPNAAGDAAAKTAGSDASDGTTPAVPDMHDGHMKMSEPLERVVGYFSSWSVYARDYHVMDLPADRLTHVNYAFLNIVDGRCALGDSYADIDKAYPGDSWDAGSLRGSFNQLLQLKAAHPELRTLLSVGGWTWSKDFSNVALTATSRATFVDSCVELMDMYGFDGLDVDWEYPVAGGLASNTYRPEDADNYVLLLKDLRAALSSLQQTRGRGEPYLLTIAAGVAPDKLVNLRVAAMMESLDWINLMAYDLHGAWETSTGHNAPLYARTGDPLAVANLVDAFLAAGAMPGKLVLGLPFYGRSFGGVQTGPASPTGLLAPANGAGPGTWEPGILEWKDLRDHYLEHPDWTRHEDPTAAVPYLYNAVTGEFISYDDPTSLAKKRDLATARGLSGVMIWEMNSDDAEHTLLNALR